MEFTSKRKLITLWFALLVSTIQAQQVDILDFGADPNGIEDNSLIINQLIDSLSSNGGGIILIPKGTFLLNESIILKSNILLKGINQEESLLFRNPLEGNWKQNKNQALITTNPMIDNENIQVENLCINGNFEKNSNGAKGGICLRNCSNSSIRSIHTKNTWHGVAFYDFKGDDSGNLIESVFSENAHAFTTKSNSGRPRGILVNDNGSTVLNSISINAGTGFYASGKNISFNGNHAENWFEDNGFYLIVDDLTVSNCSAKGGETPEKGFGSGFAVAYRNGALIENSIAENCSNYGFRIHVPQSNTKFINNKAIGCGIGFGIEIASHPYPEVCDQLVFQGNLADGSGLNNFLFRQMTNSKVFKNIAKNGNQRGVTLSTRGGIALKEYLFNNVFDQNECIDTQAKKTQLYGLYDFSVNHIKGEKKKGENNLIQHNSKNGLDEF